MKRTLRCLGILLVLFLAAGCASVGPRDTLTQVSTIDALLAGCYDGVLPCGEVLRQGDLGLGTFDHLDGEMVVLDGRVWRVSVDGTVTTVPASETTPFAAVVRFAPERRATLLQTMNLEALERQLDGLCTDTNGFYAVRIEGRFRHLRTRSVPRQEKPYPPLAQAAKQQAIFERDDVDGTLLGFRCPPYVAGINVVGWHLHFLSTDRRFGGHVLDARLARGAALVDKVHALTVLVPGTIDWGGVNLATDRSEELQRVER